MAPCLIIPFLERIANCNVYAYNIRACEVFLSLHVVSVISYTVQRQKIFICDLTIVSV